MRYAKPIRLSPEAYRNPDNVFHLVVRTHPEVGALRPPVRDAVWRSLIDETLRPDVVLFAALLMPDHIHLVAAPGTDSLVAWMGRWKSLSTRAAWTAGHHGTIWQRRFYDRALRNQEYDGVIEYVLNNPVAASLVDDATEWPHRLVRERG